MQPISKEKHDLAIFGCKLHNVNLFSLIFNWYHTVVLLYAGGIILYSRYSCDYQWPN